MGSQRVRHNLATEQKVLVMVFVVVVLTLSIGLWEKRKGGIFFQVENSDWPACILGCSFATWAQFRCRKNMRFRRDFRDKLIQWLPNCALGKPKIPQNCLQGSTRIWVSLVLVIFKLRKCTLFKYIIDQSWMQWWSQVAVFYIVSLGNVILLNLK